MAKTDRIYKIELLIRHRGQVSFAQLLETLEVSPATLKRDLEYLRGQLGAPIEYDRDSNSYRFAAGISGTGSGRRHELPGLWFSEPELYSLLMAQQLLSGLGADGLLSRHLQPLLDRIHELLGPGGETDAKALMKRVKIISALRRPVAPDCFERMGEALMRRRRLQMRYLTRARGEVGEREVSPQRLVHYCDNWYLDAWCHLREDVRSFSIDAITQIKVLNTPVREVLDADINVAVDAGYGIFGGAPKGWTTLKFTPERARWVSQEHWHPQQRGSTQVDGSYVLEIPYSDERELMGDMLRFGADVEVMAPPDLRGRIKRALHEAVGRYVYQLRHRAG